MNGVGKHRGDHGTAARGSAHPENVVVAPLHIDAVIGEERVHNDVGAGAAVKDIAHQMQPVNGQAFDDLADGRDKVGGLLDLDDGADDVLVIVVLVDLFRMGMQELLNDIGIVRRQGLPDLRARIARADRTADLDQAVECDAVPLFGGVDLGAELGKLFLGVIDQRGQLVQLGMRHGILEKQIQTLADHAGARVEKVEKGLVLAVNIRDKVFTALRQVQDRLQIDDFGAGCAQRGILPRKHFQIAQFIGGIASVGFHSSEPPSYFRVEF